MRPRVLAAVLTSAMCCSTSCTYTPDAVTAEDRYYILCCQQFDCPESVEEVMRAHGFECIGFGGSLGGVDISVRGTPETRLRARELALKFVAERGWKLGWLADHLVLQDQWDELGWKLGPWKLLASVQHRVTPTAEVLAKLGLDGITAYFEFGLRTDLIFARREDFARAVDLLRLDARPGIVIHESP